jgi:hypothetical protein
MAPAVGRLFAGAARLVTNHHFNHTELPLGFAEALYDLVTGVMNPAKITPSDAIMATAPKPIGIADIERVPMAAFDRL